MMSNERRARSIASATVSGTRRAVLSGLDESTSTFSPDEWAATSSSSVSGTAPGPASLVSESESTSVRTCSRPRELAIWPVTVSASTRRTERPIATSAAARLTAMVVLPTPPFALKMPSIWPRRDQLSADRGPDWITAPLPSSTVIWRISIASIRQRSASGE
jgi:hypothetical protein